MDQTQRSSRVYTAESCSSGEEPLDRLGAYTRSKRPSELVSEEWGFIKRHEIIHLCKRR